MVPNFIRSEFAGIGSIQDGQDAKVYRVKDVVLYRVLSPDPESPLCDVINNIGAHGGGVDGETLPGGTRVVGGAETFLEDVADLKETIETKT